MRALWSRHSFYYLHNATEKIAFLASICSTYLNEYDLKIFALGVQWTKIRKKVQFGKAACTVCVKGRGSSVVWWLFDNTTLTKNSPQRPHWDELPNWGIFRQKVAHFGDFWHKSGYFLFYCISRKIRAFGANWHFSVVWWLFDNTSMVWF